MKKRYLVLSDGTVYEGEAFGADAESVGELVFTTGMEGYTETLTDPSYYGQIVLQTFPLIGNYSIMTEDFEGKSCVKGYDITCLSVGNPHCVVFVDRVDRVDIENIGPLFENAPIFPERTNTEFVRAVNKNMLKMRVWERGNGETYACGTGACAAAAAAVEIGLCRRNEPITVKVRGGDLTVTVTDNGILLTGDTVRIFGGTVRF